MANENVTPDLGTIDTGGGDTEPTPDPYGLDEVQEEAPAEKQETAPDIVEDEEEEDDAPPAPADRDTKKQDAKPAAEDKKGAKPAKDGGDLDPEVELEVNGEKLKKPLSEVKKLAQQATAAQAQFAKGAKALKVAKSLEQKMEGVLSVLAGEDPQRAAILLEKVIGPERVKKLATVYLGQHIKRETMTEEERELTDLRNKVARLEARDQESEQQRIAREREEVRRTNYQRFVNDMTEALKAHGGVAVVEKNVRRLGELARIAGRELRRPCTREELTKLAETVRQESLSETQKNLRTLNGEALVQSLTEEQLAAIRKYEMERVTGKKTEEPGTNGTSKPGPKKREKPLVGPEGNKAFDDYINSFK